jgi:hypothetical protein
MSDISHFPNMHDILVNIIYVMSASGPSLSSLEWRLRTLCMLTVSDEQALTGRVESE